MKLEELKRFIEGPLAVYLAGECTYGRFIELIREEFPEIECSYSDLYPRLFNLNAKCPEDPMGVYWDIWKVAKDYLKEKEKE